MLKNLSTISVSVAFLALIFGCQPKRTVQNKDFDLLTDKLLVEASKQWRSDCIPLNYDGKKERVYQPVLMRSRFEIDGSECDDLYDITRNAFSDSSLPSGLRIVGMGGGSNVCWVIFERGGQEGFISAVASPRKGGVELNILRNTRNQATDIDKL